MLQQLSFDLSVYKGDNVGVEMANKKSSSKTNKKSTKGKAKGGKNAKKEKNKLTFYQKNRTKIMLFLFVATFLFVCVSFIPGYHLWAKIRGAFFAFFGFGLLFLDVCLLVLSFKTALDSFRYGFGATVLSALGICADVSSMVHLFLNKVEVGGVSEWAEQFSLAVKDGWYISSNGFCINSGVIGALIGGGLMHAVGRVVSFIILFILLILLIIVFFNISFSSIGDFVSSLIVSGKGKLDDSAAVAKEKHAANREHKKELSDIKRERKRVLDEKRRELEIKQEQEKTQNQSDDFDFFISEVETQLPSEREKSRKRRELRRPEKSSSIFTPYRHEDSPQSEVMTKNTEADLNSEQESNESQIEAIDTVETAPSFEVSTPQTTPEKFSDVFSDVIQSAEHSNTSGDELSDQASKIVETAASDAQKAAQKNRSEVEGYKEENILKREYAYPPIDCLSEPDYSKEGDHALEMRTTAAKLVDTLKSFGVETTLIGVSRGPSVTRYELQPAPGVKISKITNLADDIALNLASSGVRIEAPIPNKSAVGIEVPNQIRSMVKLREIISSSEFKNAKSKLNVALGKDITGNVSCTDLAKMPHLLIAGTTGSGKSVCLNCMIVSILYNAKPDEVKLLMIDPKQVEFSVYNGIPHLLVPVISDVRKAAGSLAWAVGEMENRYKTFASCGVRNIGGFNKMAKSNPEYEPMPQIVIFIDELNDLMMVSPKEVEDSICRLAQKARAAGMYLVVATQRPSVDVITGIIKANIPSRLSLSVSSQVDSRTILDTIGAEKLLGNGDMLFNPVGVSKPVRIQGGYVSDAEIEKIVDFLKSQEEPEYDNDVMDEIEKNAAMDKKQQASASAGSSAAENVDEMLERAIETAIDCGVISTSLLQRKLRIGYARAARIVDEIDEMGLIGPSEGGSKPRKFLMTRAQFLEMKASKGDDATFDSSNDDFDILSD